MPAPTRPITGSSRSATPGKGYEDRAADHRATTLNTNAIDGLSTPGSFFSATFDTANPVAWGFDNGGFIYRESTGDPVYDPATLAGNGTSIPPAEAAVRYADPLKSFGFAGNALGPGQLPGRPAVVDQPFGAGRAILFGFESFYRAWRESDERLILNAVLYPSGPLEAASARRAPAPAAGVADPIPLAALPAVRERSLAAIDRSARHVKIKVARRDGAKLRRAAKVAKLPKPLRRKIRWRTTSRTVTLVVRRTRTQTNEHERSAWVGLITSRLKRQHVKILLGQL